MNYEIKQVHISEIKEGDTILHTDGNIRTVSKNNIKNSIGIGITLFGDSYCLGMLPVKRLIIKNG